MATTTIKLKIPPQDFPDFSRFTPDKHGAANWLSSLVRGETAAQLSAALDELNRHPLAPELRYEVAEILRPAVEKAISNLARQFYSSLPPVIPNETQQSVERADQLCTLIGTAYTVVAVETVRSPESIKRVAPAQLACESLYRAISCAGQQVLQSLKLYQPLHMHGWLTLHQLYALAENQQLADLPVPEPLYAGGTITTAYLQAVLMGCCKPNQLRQTDLNALFGGLGQWSKLVTLSTAPADTDLYLVDLQSDQPPLYRAFHNESPADACRFINASSLIEKWHELRVASAESGIERESRLPTTVIDHLIASLGAFSKRNFNRSRSDGKVTVAVGFIDTHFFIANRSTFEKVLQGESLDIAENNTGVEFTEAQPHTDVWHKANPAEDFLHSEQSHPDQDIELDAASRAKLFSNEAEDSQNTGLNNYPSYELQLSDVSPSGYCLNWDESTAGELRNGDIISIKEEHSPQWSIAAIRWLTRVDKTHTLLGLELLSPRAQAYGACIHESLGNKSAPMRALLLPEIKVVGQPQTLITPRANFRTGQKVTVLNNTERFTVQLTHLIDATGSYAQYEFKAIRELGDILAEEGSGLQGDDDSSLWSTI